MEAVDTSRINPQFLQQVVDYRSRHPPGTVVVDPHRRFPYLTQKGSKAIRYGVGVGREGLAFAGASTVQEKKQWPHWTPTPAMIAREPRRCAKWAQGMNGGAGNPLGARALYLFKDGEDSRYRIHGTTEPDSIGKAVSSGCIRMMNQDVIDHPALAALLWPPDRPCEVGIGHRPPRVNEYCDYVRNIPLRVETQQSGCFVNRVNPAYLIPRGGNRGGDMPTRLRCYKDTFGDG